MAFYSPRLDVGYGQAENRGLSTRSLSSPSLCESTANLSLSSRSYDSTSSDRVSTRRYIELPSERPNSWISDDEENAKYQSLSETRSDIVPPLDIQSEKNYPNTRRDFTFSCRKQSEDAGNALRSEEAYKAWLLTKRRMIAEATKRRKKIEEEKKQEMEERKRLAKEKYEKWLEGKRRQKQRSGNLLTNDDISSQSSRPMSLAVKSIRYDLNPEETKARLDEWERTKRLQIERRRAKQQLEEQKRRELQEQRQRDAAIAWEKWIAEAPNKPKPVPLNRGIYTLRGTISDIFVNPNEWQPLVPEDMGDR